MKLTKWSLQEQLSPNKVNNQMKILIASLVLLSGIAMSQGAATSSSQYSAYTLSNYTNWKCGGNQSCIDAYPTYSNLVWTPVTDSYLYQNDYWKWVYTTDDTKFIICKQDYFPYSPNLSLCIKYMPSDPDYDIENDPAYCQSISWVTACVEGNSFYNPWLQMTIDCCAGNGPAYGWT